MASQLQHFSTNFPQQNSLMSNSGSLMSINSEYFTHDQNLLMPLPPQPSYSTQNTMVDNQSSKKIEYFYGRGKKNIPFKWQSEPNFDQNKKFSEFSSATLRESAFHLNGIEEFFNCLFSIQMFELIVNYTNMRIVLKKIKAEMVSLCEVKAFVGLLILFGLKNINNISVSDIWSPESIHYFKFATVSNCRNVTRQIQIFSQ